MSHRGGHTHAREKIERMATNQIHCRSMSNIKSSREQYTAELHLEIRKIYIGSIISQKLSWPDGCTSELEQQLQNLLTRVGV
jgi:hypothetical protein